MCSWPWPRGHDDSRAAVGDQRAIEQVQRVGDQARVQHVIDRDELAHLCRGVEMRVLAAGNRHRSELFLGGAVARHVRARDQRVEGRHRRPVGRFELGVTGGGLRLHGLLARKPAAQAVGHRDQHRVAHAGGYRRGCLVKDRKRGAASRGCAHAVAREDLQVLGDGLRVVHVRLGHGVAGNQAVDLVLADAGVGQGQARGGYTELGRAHVRYHAHRGVSGAHDRDGATQGMCHELSRPMCPYPSRPTGPVGGETGI